MLERVIRLAVDRLESNGGWLYLIDEVNDSYHCEASYLKDQASSNLSHEFGVRIAERVAQEQKLVVLHEKTLLDPDFLEIQSRNSVVVVGAPVILQEEILGVLIVERSDSQGSYSHEEINQLSLFSDHVALVLENKKLLRALDQQSLCLEDINQLTKALLDAHDLQSLAETLAFHLNRMIYSDGCYITLKDFQSPSIPSVVYAPMEKASLPEPSHIGHVGIANKILEAGVPIHIPDGQQSSYLDPEIAQMYSIHSALAYPLVVGEREIGAAIIVFNNEHRFGKEEAVICEQAVRSFTLALDRIQVFDMESRRWSVLEAIRKASIRLTSSLELEPVLDAILNQALTLVKGDDAHIFLYDEDQLSFAAARWADGRLSKPYSVPREDGITYSAARSGERLVTPDVDTHPLFEDWKWGGAIVSLPLQIEKQVVGVMNVAFEGPHKFQEEELRVLELLAAQAAIALQNARLFNHINTDRARVQLLLEVTNALVAELDEDKILQRAIDLTVDSFEASVGEAFLLERSTGRLRLKALSGATALSLTEIDSVLDLRLGKGLEGWVAERKEPVAIPDVNQDERWLKIEGIGDDIKSSFCVPIISEEEVLGVLSVLFKGEARLDQLDLLIAVGRQVSLALSNANKYRQINRRLAELSALQQVARVINSRLQMDQLLEEVVNQVRQVLGYEIVAVYLVEGEHVKLRAASGAEEYRLGTISLSQGIIGRVARTNQAAYVPDVTKDPDYLAAIPYSKAEIAVPLRKGDIVVGVLNVESLLKEGLSEDDFRLLLLLGDQVSVAIENASLYEHLRDQAGKLEEIVDERTAELAEALEKARIAERLKTQFVADVSHELRTPLANIRLYIELLSFGNPERFADYLETLARETDRLVNLIEELLAISRLDSGASIPNPQPIDLNHLVSNLVEDRQRLLNEKSIQLFLKPMEQLPLVSADEYMITQVVANLVTNAMHYTKPGGSISITTSMEQEAGQDWAKLSISDTGIGIPPDEQERVFERFYRGIASRMMPVPGTGLGLAICKELIDQHHGKITMKSEIDKGSEFVIWLPVPSKL